MHSINRRASIKSLNAAAAVLSMLAVSVGALTAQQPSKPEFPRNIRLAAKARGEAAITALGKHLPEVAAHYRKTPEELRKLFRSDHTLWADPEGRLFYGCEFHGAHEVPAETEPATQSISPTDQAPFPTSDAFLLHSRPGANRVIYLDFDGHVDNTAGNWKDGASAPPFDLDGDPTTFNASERERIIYIWQRVAEDYAMYDIDVTTEDPGLEALRKSNSSDQAYGIRACIGGRSGGTGDWFTTNVGGVAFVGNFDSANDVPCWVFPQNLGNSEKNIAEATSHEVGHTLGLNHDGITNGAEYYSGQDNWSPIMGLSYGKPISQWSKGEYANANNLQDDLAVMLTQGAVYRPDDHANSIAAATVIAADNSPYETGGTISTNTDLDYFQIEAAGGPLSITVNPAPRGGNLRIELKLYDAAGSLLETATAADTSAGTQPVTLSHTLNAGICYFSVDGIANGNPLTTGYSDYASLGQYLVSITGMVFQNPSWLPTAAGSYTWNETSNWISNLFKNEAGATINIRNNIAGNQTLNLTNTSTLGNLLLGDSDNTHAFTLAAGGGSLVFDNLTAAASVVKTSGGSDVVAAPISISAGLTVQQSASGNLTFSGPLSGIGPLTKAGAGTLTLSGTNNYSGATTIGGGTLSLGNGAALQNTSTISIAGGSTLSTSIDGIVVAVPITLGAAGTASTIAFSRNTSASGSLKLNGLIAGEGSLILSTPNVNSANNLQTIFLGSLPNTYRGNTTITTGNTGNTVTVRSGVTNSLPTTTVLKLDGGKGSGTGRTVSFDLNGFNQTLAGLTNVNDLSLRNQRVTNSGTAATLTVNNPSSHTYGSPATLSGALALTKQGGGTLSLTSSNTQSGSTNIGGGVLDIRHADALGTTAAGTSVANGATLQIQGGVSTAAEPLSLESGVSTTPMLRSAGGDNTWNGTIASTGTGATTRISSDTGLLVLANTLTGNSAATQLVLQGAGNILVSGRITGSSGLTSGNTGAGTRTLGNPNNDFTGNVTLSGGRLKLGAAEVIPNGPGKGNVTLGAASTLDLASFPETLNGLSSTGTNVFVDNTVAGTPTLTVGDNDQSSTFGGVIRNSAGTLSLTKTGTATLTLTGNNTYTGITTLSAGNLAMASNLIAGSQAILIGNGATLQATSAAFTLAANQSVTGTGPTGHVQTQTSTGLITTGGNTIGSIGTLKLTRFSVLGNGNQITGGDVQSGGSGSNQRGLLVGNGGTGILTLDGGTFTSNGGATNYDILGNTASAGDGSLIIAGGDYLNAAGTGTLSLGNGTASGTLTIASGSATLHTLRYHAGTSGTKTSAIVNLDGGSLTVSNITITSGTTKEFNFNGGRFIAGASLPAFSGVTLRVKDGGANIDTNGHSFAISGALLNHGTGGLAKSGDGTLTLTENNTYSGATIINAGTLAMGAGNVLPDTSAVSINTATLHAASTGVETAGTLDVTGNSTIHLDHGASLAFADSRTVDWAGGTLDLTGAFVAGASLRFGTDDSGLTPAQLTRISASGSGPFALDASGYLIEATIGYAAWQQANSTTGGLDEDHDNDGVPNGIEYFLGGSTSNGFTALPEVVNTDGVLSITWTKADSYIGTYGAGFVVETSLTLAPDSWTPEILAPDPGSTVAITGSDVKFTFPAGQERFARLKIIGP